MKTVSTGFRWCMMMVGVVLWCTAATRIATAEQKSVAALLEPKEMSVNARGAVLMDATTGQVLVEFQKHTKIPPASFAKILTLYIVFDTIKRGKLNLDDEVAVSKKAWKTEGSKMFIEVGSKVSVRDLIKGIAVVSGNDACVAMAEHLYGTTEAFVAIMNETAQKLGMRGSHFDSPHGLPSEEQYTTAYDMALLARSYIQEFPEVLQFHSMQEYTYSEIKQYNRNSLLRKDPSVDGLKTGYVSAGGYHLLVTAKRENRRLIAVVMGADNRSMREKEARKLLNYGYQHFELLPLFTQDQVLAEIPVWKGARNTVSLVPAASGVMTVPAELKTAISHERVFPKDIVAPVRQGQEIGKAVIKWQADVIKSIPLVAQHEVRKAGLVKSLSHSVYLVGTKNTGVFLTLGVLCMGVVMGYVLVATRRRKRRRPGLRL
jgi:D-alanyl-D-alanine carboxypeptidase (penicillin-binding protein 5/6)